MRQVTPEQLTGLTDNHISWLSPSIGIHVQMHDPLQSMINAAKRDGIEIAIASGYRSFERQQAIWNRKMTGEVAVLDINERSVDINSIDSTDLIKAIMLFSALPGGSRHHWGTDIDIYSPSLLAKDQKLKLAVSEYDEYGIFAVLSDWLTKNAGQYGFRLPYSTYSGGVACEPWHLSYQPLSSTYENAMTIDTLRTALKKNEVNGKAEILANLDELYQRFIISSFLNMTNT